jgi:DNA-binding NarL/FixJ family response regulator
MSSSVEFVIIDDHPSMRAGIRAILERTGEFVAVGEAATVEEMCMFIREKQPQLLIVDINLSEGSGFDVFSCVTQASYTPRVLFLSMFIKPTYVVKAVTLGGAGYVTKNSPGEVILMAARTVSSGHHFFDPHAADVVAEWIRSVPNADNMVQDESYNSLSEREKEILILFARGDGSREVAEKLHISTKTASNYRNSILRTLGFDTVFELKAFAEDVGLL